MLLLTSKGAAGVTGCGFIVLAATLSAVGGVPVAGLALILGIDRFMSEARALTNLIGNGVPWPSSRWEGRCRLRLCVRGWVTRLRAWDPQGLNFHPEQRLIGVPSS